MRRLLPVLLLASAGLASCAPDEQQGSLPKIVVFFEHASVAVSGTARQSVARAAKWAQSHPTDEVTVAGYAAANGDLDADAQLAVQRTRIVTALLEQDGVDASRIQSIPRPPSNEISKSVGARRVEITVGSGS